MYLSEEREEYTCADRRADNACDIGTHSVHEKEVGRIFFLTNLLRDTGCHRNGGNARRADEGIDFAAGKLAHDLTADETTEGGEHEGAKSEEDDLEGIEREEVFRACRCTDGDTEEDGDDVDELVLRGLGKTLGHAADVEKVTEHQETNQRRRIGQERAHNENNHDGENDLFELGNGAKLLHLDRAFLLGGHHLHQRRLDERDERHIGVRRDGDRAEKLRREGFGDEDRRGAVRTADDTDRRCRKLVKAEEQSAEERRENAELRRAAEEDALRVGNEGREVGHRADAEEDQRRIDAELNAEVKEIEKTAVRDNVLDDDMRVGILGIDEQFHMEKLCAGQVSKEHARRNGKKQERFKLLLDGKIHQHADDDVHDERLDEIHDIVVKKFCDTGAFPKGQQVI